jgi:hypothetical protein
VRLLLAEADVALFLSIALPFHLRRGGVARIATSESDSEAANACASCVSSSADVFPSSSFSSLEFDLELLVLLLVVLDADAGLLSAGWPRPLDELLLRRFDGDGVDNLLNA